MSISYTRKSDFVYFKLETKSPITRDEAVKLQEANGYVYKTNGLYAFIVEKIKENKYEITWACRG